MLNIAGVAFLYNVKLIIYGMWKFIEKCQNIMTNTLPHHIQVILYKANALNFIWKGAFFIGHLFCISVVMNIRRNGK